MRKTKFKILAVAFNLFLQKSFKEVTMQEIVAKTGLSKGAFYHYFKSKDELFSEVVETFYVAAPTTPMKPLNMDSLHGFYHDYIDHVVMVFKALGESMKTSDSDSNLNYFSMGLEAMRRLPAFREKIRIINNEVKKIWMGVIKNAREKGEVTSSMTDEEIASCFLYLNEGIGMRYALEGRASESDKELSRLWDSFYGILKTK
jgi:AcrR family transcriptional regulator